MSFFSGRTVRCLITEGLCTAPNFSVLRNTVLDTVRLAVEAQIELVQIREKLLPTRLLFDLTAAAARLVQSSGTKLLINERFDVALAARADGVHLTSASIPVARVRECVPSTFIIGVSTHSRLEVTDAKAGGADYVLFGPIFPTPGKELVKGLDELQMVSSRVSPFPVLAVGGVNTGNHELALKAGAGGIAAIRYLNDFVRIAK